MDVLSAASCLQIIASKTKQQLLTYLHQLDVGDLVVILFAFLSQHQPTIKSIVDKNWTHSTNKTAKNIQNIFLPKIPSPNINISTGKLLSLPSM
eukprot:200478_1